MLVFVTKLFQISPDFLNLVSPFGNTVAVYFNAWLTSFSHFLPEMRIICNYPALYSACYAQFHLLDSLIVMQQCQFVTYKVPWDIQISLRAKRMKP